MIWLIDVVILVVVIYLLSKIKMVCYRIRARGIDYIDVDRASEYYNFSKGRFETICPNCHQPTKYKDGKVRELWRCDYCKVELNDKFGNTGIVSD